MYYLFGAQGCSEPLDKIYAYTSLSSCGIPFPVDYNCSMIVALVNAATYCAVESYTNRLSLFQQPSGSEGTPHSLPLFAVAMQRLVEDWKDAEVSEISENRLNITELAYVADRVFLAGSTQVQLPGNNPDWIKSTWPMTTRFFDWFEPREFEEGYYLFDQRNGFRTHSLWSITIVARRQSGRRCKVVGRLKSHPAFGYGFERYAASGLPGVEAMLRYEDPNILGGAIITDNLRRHGESLLSPSEAIESAHRALEVFEHLVYTDVRAMVVLFGLPDDDMERTSVRSTALRIIADNSEEGNAYVPVESWFKEWSDSDVRCDHQDLLHPNWRDVGSIKTPITAPRSWHA